ncbi:MAG: response regulator transcription factor [Thermomicrobiales bacterium]|nr:response regulator transcription factor [Thermomicrobiales bacterium]
MVNPGNQPPHRILVVEDDPGVAAVVRRTLAFEGYRVQMAASGPEAMRALAVEIPDLMILDVMIPGFDGFEVSRRLRESEDHESAAHLPILMLTARDAVSDRVKGLDSGADDYLIKPFALDEMLARVRALLRRSQPAEEGARDQTLGFEDVTVDLPSRTTLRGERRLDLTPREFDLLAYFMRNPNIVLTRDQIMERIWGNNYWGDSNVLEVFVANLRRALEAENEARIIQTVRGVGYVLRLAPER